MQDSSNFPLDALYAVEVIKNGKYFLLVMVL